MTSPTITQQEWAHLAWAMGALEVGVDIEQLDLEWAERVYGEQARQFITNHDALMTLRFGPDTVPTRPPVSARADGSIPETADEFARAVQALLLDPELVKDLDIRDEQIACLAIDYAAQFLPGGIRYPAHHRDRK
jgi:hypothetical protein